MTEEQAVADRLIRHSVDGVVTCFGCGETTGADGQPWKSEQAAEMHYSMWCEGNPNASGQKRKRSLDVSGAVVRRSKRGQQQRSSGVGLPSVIDQIPRARNQEAPILAGSSAYYFRRDGATIAEGLTRYPGGAGSGKQGRNAAYYRQRQEGRGLVFLGQHLTRPAIEKMMDIILGNRDDYVLFLREELEQCNADLESGVLNVEQRDQQRRRKSQLNKQLAIAEQPIDVDDLTEQLAQIGQASRLARTFNRAQLDVIREMIGDSVKAHEASLAEQMAGSLPERETPHEKDESSKHIDLTEEGPF